MPRQKNTKPTNIYWLYDTRPEKVAVYGEMGEPFYCGKTIYSTDRRLASHLVDTRRFNRPVQACIRDCGEHVQIRLMEVVPFGDDWVEREKHWIATLRVFYPNARNISAGGQGVPGLILSAESRAKMSEARKARINKPHSAESRAKISATQKGRVRPPFSAETRAKMSASHTGLKTPMSDAGRANISAGKLGKKRGPLSDQHRARISAAKRNR